MGDTPLENKITKNKNMFVRKSSDPILSHHLHSVSFRLRTPGKPSSTPLALELIKMTRPLRSAIWSTSMAAPIPIQNRLWFCHDPRINYSKYHLHIINIPISIPWSIPLSTIPRVFVRICRRIPFSDTKICQKHAHPSIWGRYLPDRLTLFFLSRSPPPRGGPQDVAGHVRLRDSAGAMRSWTKRDHNPKTWGFLIHSLHDWPTSHVGHLDCSMIFRMDRWTNGPMDAFFWCFSATKSHAEAAAQERSTTKSCRLFAAQKLHWAQLQLGGTTRYGWRRWWYTMEVSRSPWGYPKMDGLFHGISY